jgi:NAD(P)-dependent dehydrogenase (short-subunit alcohol dehydrogenase family)
MNRLENKVAIITGGAGGIGQGTARLFVAEGAKVLLVDVDRDALTSLVAPLGEAHASACVADVSDPAETERYVRTALDRYGRIDVLFSNAGVEGRAMPLADYPVETFDKVFAVNVRGVFLSLKYTIPVMTRGGGGSIVITSSIAGLRGSAGLSAYAASKHALVGMMRSAALEYAPASVRINTIHPAPIETRMMRSLEEQLAPDAVAQARSALETSIPMGRYGTPEEVARLVLFLASDESRYCSGGVYSVDGAMSAGMARRPPAAAPAGS